MKQIPNILSMSRLIATVAIFVLVLYNTPWGFLSAAILFFLASITDFFDGYLARKLKITSTLGVFLDLAADKVLVAAILIALVQVGLVPAWIPFIIISREFVVSGLRSLAADRGRVIAAGPLGKQKTFITLVAMGLLLLARGLGADHLFLLNWQFDFAAANAIDWLYLISEALLVLATFWTILSGIEYIWGSLPMFRQEKKA